jgi:hypothetical protein
MEGWAAVSVGFRFEDGRDWDVGVSLVVVVLVVAMVRVTDQGS